MMHPSRQLTDAKSGRPPAGFTLLEVMLAAAILIVITVAVSRFTVLTVQSAEFSAQNSAETLACDGLGRLLAAQLSALPAGQNESLVGMSIKSSSGRRDALQLIVPAGNGLLTPDAKGLYQVTLLIREIPRGSGKMVLGLERQPWIDDDDDDDDDDTPGSGSAKTNPLATVEKLPSDWVPLMDGVQQLEIAYFDSRLDSWVDRWTDLAMLPNLVRLRLTLSAGQPPYEIVERVPGGGVKRGAAAITFPVGPVVGQPGTNPAPVAPPAARQSP